MEDEWEGMNLASLHDNPGSRPCPARTSNFLPLNFQEFLPRPTNPQTTTTVHGGGGGCALSESPRPPPATTLSLNPCPGYPLSFPLGPNPFCQALPGFPNGPRPPRSLNEDPFDGLASPCSRLPDIGRKRYHQAENSSSGDRAYTNELEMEVAQLMEENARLKQQQEQLYFAAASQVSKKHGLHRSSTAPF